MKYRNSPLQIEKRIRIKQLRLHPGKQPFPENVPFSSEAMASLEEQVKGRIVYPWSDGYNLDRREFNNVYQANPLIIIYVGLYLDVRLALSFAQANNLPVAIRSGGHSFAGYSVCDGMIIDVSGLNNIYVNTYDNTALIEAGCTFERIFPIIEQYGLHMPSGGCPTVSVAGYMQGGGYGLTSRTYGMNCDCVIECTVMLADGRILTANQDQNQDLFWAIRGGTGGNFGVLLNIKYQLYELGNIRGLKVKWIIEQEPETAALALFTIQENYLSQNTFPNLGIETILTTDTDNLKKVFFCATWIGSEADLNKALQPLKNIPGGEFDDILTGKYSVVNNYVLEGTPNIPTDIEAYGRSAIIDRSLDQVEWKNILTFFLTAPNQYTMIDMEFYGGKINTIPAGTNAFIHRNAKMDFFCLSFFDTVTHDQPECEAWMESYYKFMVPYTNGHSYQNYPDRKQEDFRRAYWGNYYNQLVFIKRKYDPTNYFKFQQSIGPALMEDNNEQQITLFDHMDIKYESY